LTKEKKELIYSRSFFEKAIILANALPSFAYSTRPRRVWLRTKSL